VLGWQAVRGYGVYDWVVDGRAGMVVGSRAGVPVGFVKKRWGKELDVYMIKELFLYMLGYGWYM